MRKRIVYMVLSVAVLITALLGLSGTAFANSKDFSIIRVYLSMRGTNEVCTQTQFFVDGNYSVNGLPLERDLYTVILQGSSASLYRGDIPIASGPSIRLVQHAPTPGRNNFIWHNNYRNGWCAYLGDMEVRVISGEIRLINHIYIEEYLYGVVPHEMSDSFPLEALKAQAVCARTYAIDKINSASSSALYDINDTSGNQVYKGFNPAHTRAIQAVNETKGQVLKCGSEYVEGYYAASNGGWTDIPQHSWTATATLKPYHVIKQDPYDLRNPSSRQDLIIFPKAISPEAQIQYSSGTVGKMTAPDDVLTRNATATAFMKDSALSAVRARGYIADNASQIDILGFSSFATHTHDTTSSQKHGGQGSYNGNDFTGQNLCPDFRMADVTMTVSADRYATPEESGGVMLGDVDGNGVINISDYTQVRLHILGLRHLEGNALLAADVNRDGVVNITDYTQIRLHILNLRPITGNTTGALIREAVTVSFTIDMHQLHSDGSYPVYSTTNLRLLIIEDTGTEFRLYRRRYGHGIGLSQRGAQQQANEGRSYQDILLFYYEGTHIADEPSITAPVLTSLEGLLDTTNATVVYSSSLNVRSSASSANDQNIIGKLPANARITVTIPFETDSWHRIRYSGYTAYVSANTAYVVLDS